MGRHEPPHWNQQRAHPPRGAGVRGAKWARVIAEAPDATLAGIVDPDEARARRARDAHAPDALVGRDFASALAHIAADAVVIATRPTAIIPW